MHKLQGSTPVSSNAANRRLLGADGPAACDAHQQHMPSGAGNREPGGRLGGSRRARSSAASSSVRKMGASFGPPLSTKNGLDARCTSLQKHEHRHRAVTSRYGAHLRTV